MIKDKLDQEIRFQYGTIMLNRGIADTLAKGAALVGGMLAGVAVMDNYLPLLIGSAASIGIAEVSNAISKKEDENFTDIMKSFGLKKGSLYVNRNLNQFAERCALYGGGIFTGIALVTQNPLPLAGTAISFGLAACAHREERKEKDKLIDTEFNLLSLHKKTDSVKNFYEKDKKNEKMGPN